MQCFKTAKTAIAETAHHQGNTMTESAMVIRHEESIRGNAERKSKQILFFKFRPPFESDFFFHFFGGNGNPFSARHTAKCEGAFDKTFEHHNGKHCGNRPLQLNSQNKSQQQRISKSSLKMNMVFNGRCFFSFLSDITLS